MIDIPYKPTITLRIESNELVLSVKEMIAEKTGVPLRE